MSEPLPTIYIIELKGTSALCGNMQHIDKMFITSDEFNYDVDAHTAGREVVMHLMSSLGKDAPEDWGYEFKLNADFFPSSQVALTEVSDFGEEADDEDDGDEQVNLLMVSRNIDDDNSFIELSETLTDGDISIRLETAVSPNHYIAAKSQERKDALKTVLVPVHQTQQVLIH